MNGVIRTGNRSPIEAEPTCWGRGGIQAIARRAWLRLFGSHEGDEAGGGVLPSDGLLAGGQPVAELRTEDGGGTEAVRGLASREGAIVAVQGLGGDIGVVRSEHGPADDQENRQARNNPAAEGLHTGRVPVASDGASQSEKIRSDSSTPLVANDRAQTRMIQLEGGYAYLGNIDVNPYKSGTREAKAWDLGYIDEHRNNPRPLELPEWVDVAQWNLATATAKLYGLQNIMAMSDVPMGNLGGGSAIAMLRGIPDEPPKWLVKNAWDRASNSRYTDIQRLEKHCFLDSKVGIRQMYDREEARKKCCHTFEDVIVKGQPIGERVCPKCGTLESMTIV